MYRGHVKLSPKVAMGLESRKEMLKNYDATWVWFILSLQRGNSSIRECAGSYNFTNESFISSPLSRVHHCSFPIKPTIDYRYTDSLDSNWLIDEHPSRPGVVFATSGSGHAYKARTMCIVSSFITLIDTHTVLPGHRKSSR